MRSWWLGTLAAAVLAAGLHWGTFAVGGSDSYCYAHQAERWASGVLRVAEPLALEAPWPDAPRTFAPAGHVPSPVVPGAIAPICPAGLSIFMAPFVAIGGARALFLVVPFFGVLLVLATDAVGRRYAPRVGLAAAVLTASSPVFLFQQMQPMSDVPAAALWVLAVACATGTSRRAPLAAGGAASLAILVRPNLLPLGIVIGLALLVRPGQPWPVRLRQAALFAAGCVPGCGAVALIQQTFYGSMFQSGYGSLSALFGPEHIGPNLHRYLGWLTSSQTPFWLCALAAPVLWPGWLTGLLLAIVLTTAAVYLPYTVFDDWWFLRFLLPAIPLLLVLAAAGADGVVRVAIRAWTRGADLRVAPAGRHVARRAAVAAIVLGGLVALVASRSLVEARQRQVFDLARLESRYVRSGLFVARRLPANALVITSWESGSVRFYSSRLTLVWDVLDPAWLDRAVTFARSRGLEPYLLFERWEEPIFRRRFAESPMAALDWPPIAEVASVVRIYRPDDQSRYRSGSAVQTEYAR